MPESSTLAHQLALLGIKIPPWPMELEEDKNKGNWITTGKAYLKVIKLWQAQVQDTSPTLIPIIDQLLRHLQEINQLGMWDQLV